MYLTFVLLKVTKHIVFEVLHLIGMALQEEKQHLENVMEEHVVTFTFTQKISSMYILFTKLTQDISDFKYVISPPLFDHVSSK